MDLQPIDRTDRGVGRLNAALTIYQKTILTEAQNPVKQIIYWIEHSKEALTDEFRCFALMDGKNVIGYLQYSYFAEEHIFFFEYLCIQDRRRTGLVPSQALECIEEHLAQNYRPSFTIVFEIARKKRQAWELATGQKTHRLFFTTWISNNRFHNHYPVLQSYQGGTSYPADLMVSLPDKRTIISSTDLRTILRCIYFKHYLRWDKPFLDDASFSLREQLINELYSREAARIGKDDFFTTNGDDKKTLFKRFAKVEPKISALLEKIFAPKMPRLIVIFVLMLFAEWFLGNVFYLLPLVIAVSAIFCLVEDTATSRKLLVTIISKISFAKLRSS